MNKEQLKKGRDIERSIESASSSLGHIDTMIENCATKKPLIDLEIVSSACGGAMIREVDSDLVYGFIVALKMTLQQQIRDLESEFAAL